MVYILEYRQFDKPDDTLVAGVFSSPEKAQVYVQNNPDYGGDEDYFFYLGGDEIDNPETEALDYGYWMNKAGKLHDCVDDCHLDD